MQKISPKPGNFRHVDNRAVSVWSKAGKPKLFLEEPKTILKKLKEPNIKLASQA